jgi:hypothetical protein
MERLLGSIVANIIDCWMWMWMLLRLAFDTTGSKQGATWTRNNLLIETLGHAHSALSQAVPRILTQGVTAPVCGCHEQPVNIFPLFARLCFMVSTGESRDGGRSGSYPLTRRCLTCSPLHCRGNSSQGAGSQVDAPDRVSIPTPCEAVRLRVSLPVVAGHFCVMMVRLYAYQARLVESRGSCARFRDGWPLEVVA